MVKAKVSKSKIVDVECIISTTESGNGLLVSWEGDMYITNVQFLNELIDGKLKTLKGKKAKGINLGLLSGDGIVKTDLYLNIKGKSIYFSPSEGTLLVVPVSTVKEIIEGTVQRTHMGKIED